MMTHCMCLDPSLDHTSLTVISFLATSEDHRRGDPTCAFLEAYDETERNKKKRAPTRTVSKASSRLSAATG